MVSLGDPTRRGASPAQAYSGYYRRVTAEPDRFLCQTGRGTPGGEYLRRFWQPVAYASELGRVPLRVRALGEDLVVFRDGGGRIGALHMRCCHRNTSLEYGLIEQHGLRCCYHGRLFDVDGTILEMPGEPAADKLRRDLSQGAYPVHAFGGIVFIYMGPPERIPVFPVFDRLDLPGVRIVPGVRFQQDCNWIQIKENTVDPHHTHVLHVIPQLRGMEHFAAEFGHFPVFIYTETQNGVAYMAARRVGDKIWLRSAETIGANAHSISSIFETGRDCKPAAPPFMTFWALPVDDEHTMTFYVSHVLEDEPMPFEKRRALEVFGQVDDRPYSERQWLPGDHDAQVGQGPVNVHALEHLGTNDRGVVLFRRFIRRGIEAVQAGQDPVGFYLEQGSVPATFASDRVVPISELGGDADDPEVLRQFAERMANRYRSDPPMAQLSPAGRHAAGGRP
jgi:phenylpropionate dioxygenase-like ring-hydroxylating dioxygenase large terminal subunit